MVKTRPPKEGNCFHSCHAPCKPTRAIRRTERYRCVKTCMYIYIYMSMFAFHWLRKISRIWLIFVQIVEFMTMLKHHNRKVQRQRVFHSLPSIAVPKRNELVDDSWAPQLVQFISQYFNCDVITLLWMWAICCCAHVQGFEQLGQLVIAPLTKPNVEKYSSCSFNPSSQATIKHPYYYDSPYSHLAPSHFREEGSGLKAARIVNTQAAQDPARESRRYKKNMRPRAWMSNAWKKKRVSRKRTTISPSKQHHQLGQQDRVVSGSDQSRTQRERAQRYPFAGAGQQQSGQQGQGQLQIGAPLPLAHRLMLCLIVVLNQWRAIRRTSRCFGQHGGRGFGSRKELRQDGLLRQQVQLQHSQQQQEQQRLQPPWQPLPLLARQEELPSPAQEAK